MVQMSPKIDFDGLYTRMWLFVLCLPQPKLFINFSNTNKFLWFAFKRDTIFNREGKAHLNI